MKLFLIIVFFWEGQPRYEDGWYPMEQSNYETCMEKRQRVEDQLFNIFLEWDNPLDVDSFTVICDMLPHDESLPNL